MAKFLIEVAHDADELTCAKAVEVFLKSGSHFLTHADWGCMDGEHKAWIVVDVDNKDEARAVVPPAFRSEAKVVQLNAFTLSEIGEFIRRYEPKSIE